MTKSQITAHQFRNALGQLRWRFATPSVLRSGELTFSLSNWASKAGALKAGRREWLS